MTVTATPNPGWSFTGWSGACSGSGACSMVMDGAKSVVAGFEHPPVTLTASASAGGTVSPSGQKSYAYGTQVTVSATKNSGYNFTGWTGACSGAGTCAITMDGDKSVTANFSEQEQRVTVNPTSVTYGEPLEITLEGFPGDRALPAGAITFDGERVPIPGFFGAPGARPVADEHGVLSFTTTLPFDADVGLFSLTVEVSPLFSAETSLTFKGSHLILSPATAIPNQSIILSGSGFASTPGGAGTENPYQITGTDSSFIRIGGEVLRPPHVEYPIQLDESGSFFARITIPSSPTTEHGGNLQLEVTDSSGRKGVADLLVPTPGITVEPEDGFPGQHIKITGHGFIASNPFLARDNEVVISYWVLTGDTPNEYFVPTSLGTALVDDAGRFDFEFDVPQRARVPSSNQIMVTPSFGGTLKVPHSVPSPRITVSPQIAFVGDEIQIDLAGLNSNYFVSAGSLKIGGQRAPIPGYFGVPGEKPRTDAAGSVTFTTRVPSLTAGVQIVAFTQAAGAVMNGSLTVNEGLLQMVPASAVPGQIIFVRSRHFSPSLGAESGSSSDHEISGKGESVVQIGGTSIGSPFAEYPIQIASDGQAFFPLRVPTEGTVTSATELQVSAVDTGGRRSTGTLSIAKPAVTISPETGLRGSYVTLAGEGFVAGSDSRGSAYRIDVEYGGQRIRVVYPDSRGSFETRFKVPNDAGVNTQHEVTTKVFEMDIQASTAHWIPAPAIEIEPDPATIGGSVTITGSGYPVNVPITRIAVGHIQAIAPPASTDESGNFSIVVTIPAGTRLGRNTISVTATGYSKSRRFQVVAN